MININKYEVTLVTKEPFRIGGIQDPLKGQEAPVATVGGKIVIPGSSLKGAFRSEIEKYLIETYYDKASRLWQTGKEHLMPCIPSPKKQISKDEHELIQNGKYRKDGCHYPCDPRQNKCGDVQHSICPVCYLLGANGLNGFIRVPFLYTDMISASDLYSARLDRAIGTEISGTNRPYSLIPKEITFKGTIEVTIKNEILDSMNWILGQKRNLKESTFGDLWLDQDGWTQEKIINDLIIERFKNINLMGGFKSKGCGKVKIEITPME